MTQSYQMIADLPYHLAEFNKLRFIRGVKGVLCFGLDDNADVETTTAEHDGSLNVGVLV